MPVMYHFRVDKIIENPADQGMYEKLIKDLDKSHWSDYFEFDAKAKDMGDGQGKQFRFTAKVRASESTTEKYNQQFSELVEHLVANYSIDLSDAKTAKAKLKNTKITKASKTITDNTFDTLTSNVHQIIDTHKTTINDKTAKMATLWAADEKNIFTEVEKLSSRSGTTEGLAQTRDLLAGEQNELNATLESMKQQTQYLAQRQTTITELIAQLDNSALPEHAQAIVNETRQETIPAKETVQEIKYKPLVKENYPDYEAISKVNARTQELKIEQLAKNIYHQHKTKNWGGTGSTKTEAEQAFAQAFFQQNIEDTTSHLMRNDLDALMKIHDQIDEQFLNISKTQRAIEQEKPRNTLAEIVVTNNTIHQLQQALAIQKSFEAQYKNADEIIHTFDDTAPNDITPNEVVLKEADVQDNTDSETASESSEATATKLPMYHYRIQQDIDAKDKAYFESIANDFGSCTTDRNIFECRVQNYPKEPNNPTRFMLRVKQKNPVSIEQFDKEVRDAMQICIARGIDVSHFGGASSKEETKKFNSNAYVTQASKSSLDEVLKDVIERPRTAQEAFNRIKKLLPNDPRKNEFLKIEQLTNSPSLMEEESALQQENTYLTEKLDQIRSFEAINEQLRADIKEVEMAVKASAPQQHKGFDVLGAHIAENQVAIKQLPIDRKIKHSPSTMKTSSLTVFELKEYSNLLSSSTTAQSELLNAATQNLPQVKKGVFSSEKTDPWASAVLHVNMTLAVEHAQQQVGDVKALHANALNLHQANNGINPEQVGGESLKDSINSKKSASEIHAENKLLHKELQSWQLALELSKGMNMTQNKEASLSIEEEMGPPPPIPKFSHEDQERQEAAVKAIKLTAQATVDSTMKSALTNVVAAMTTNKEGSELKSTKDSNAPYPPISDKAPSNTQANSIPLPPEKPKAEFKPPPPPPPRATGPSGKPPPPPPPPPNTTGPSEKPPTAMPFNLLDGIRKGAKLKSTRDSDVPYPKVSEKTSSTQKEAITSPLERPPMKNELLSAIKQQTKKTITSDSIDKEQAEKKEKNSIAAGIKKASSRRESDTKVIEAQQAQRKEAHAAKEKERRKSTLVGQIETGVALKKVTAEMLKEDKTNKKKATENAKVMGGFNTNIIERRKKMRLDDDSASETSGWSDSADENDSDNNTPTPNASLNSLQYSADEDGVNQEEKPVCNYGQEGTHSPIMYGKSSADSRKEEPKKDPDSELDQSPTPG